MLIPSKWGLIASFIVAMVARPAMAQVPNGGFESGSGFSIDQWINPTGGARAAEEAAFLTSMDDTTLRAYEGSRFALLQYLDNEPAVIRTAFPHTLRSSDVQARVVYVPTSSLQRFSVSVTYLRYPGPNSVDTVMHRVFYVNPYAGQMIRNYDWVHLTLSFDKSDFRSSELPDTCIITIQVDAGKVKYPGTLLMLDDVKFGNDVLGLPSPNGLLDIAIYPNPSPNGRFFMDGVSLGDVIDIHSLDGKWMESLKVEADNIVYLPISQELKTGAYLVALHRNGSTPCRFLLLVP